MNEMTVMQQVRSSSAVPLSSMKRFSASQLFVSVI